MDSRRVNTTSASTPAQYQLITRGSPSTTAQTGNVAKAISTQTPELRVSAQPASIITRNAARIQGASANKLPPATTMPRPPWNLM